MEQITKNFSYDELIASATAKRLGLDNTPNEVEKEKLKKLAIEILQPIRDAWRSPIVVNSAFRSEAVNKAVGGVKNSQHRLGEAADITIGGKERNLRRHGKKQTLLTEVPHRADLWGNGRRSLRLSAFGERCAFLWQGNSLQDPFGCGRTASGAVIDL